MDLNAQIAIFFPNKVLDSNTRMLKSEIDHAIESYIKKYVNSGGKRKSRKQRKQSRKQRKQSRKQRKQSRKQRK